MRTAKEIRKQTDEVRRKELEEEINELKKELSGDEKYESILAKINEASGRGSYDLSVSSEDISSSIMELLQLLGYVVKERYVHTYHEYGKIVGYVITW